MRILNRYIVLDYLLIFLTALGLITFMMTVTTLIKAVDLMARGISPVLIAKFFFQNIPYILSYSMPISTLFAALLLFGRLSMDNEISAMKSCGLSLWRVVAPLLVLSILLSGICMYINCEVAPQAKHANKQLLQSAGVEEPINLIEEGRFISDFPGLLIYVGRKNGNVVKDVVAYQLTDEGRVERSVRAKRGEIYPDNENRILRVKLYEGSMEQPDMDDPHDVSKTTYTPFESILLPPLDFNKITKSGSVKKKRSHMQTAEIIDYIRNIDSKLPHLDPEQRRIEKTRAVIEANRRVAIAIGCFTFMLVGIPLGVKSHRKETSIGMVMSLAIVFAYYIFIIIAESLAGVPGLHPNLILWLPMIGMQIFGIWMIHRSS